MIVSELGVELDGAIGAQESELREVLCQNLRSVPTSTMLSAKQRKGDLEVDDVSVQVSGDLWR